MRNLLVQLEEHNIPHFIIKSYETATFEVDRHKAVYHIYHQQHPEIGRWNFKCDIYDRMRVKAFSQDELRWFHQNLQKYEEEQRGNNGFLNAKDGKIWVNKIVGFDPRMIKRKEPNYGKIHDDTGVLQHG